MHIVETTDLTKIYGPTVALNQIALAVPSGSTYGLVGPNGAGKTTLLGILSGLRNPTSGSVRIGVPRQRIAVLPDTPRFESWLSGREVVELAQNLAGHSPNPDAVNSVLVEAGLIDAASYPSGGYSRGMLQRLGLAATMVTNPQVLLLDEPSSALDPAGRREVLELVGRLKGRATVIFSSHILGDVQEVCDTVGILRAGEMLFQGPLDELLVGRAGSAFLGRTRGEARAAAGHLAGASWVAAVDIPNEDILRISVTDRLLAERELVAALSAAGVGVVSMIPASADLEQVFLELTS